MEFRKMVTITLYTRQQETLMYRTVFWTLWERKGVGRSGRMAQGGAFLWKVVWECRKLRQT